jgi:hypothetical protein
MGIVPVSTNVEKVRGVFVTAVAGATVVFTERGNLVTSPATHYADAAGGSPSTAALTADSSGAVITYLDTGSYDIFYRASATSAWSGPVPIEAVDGSGGNGIGFDSYALWTTGTSGGQIYAATARIAGGTLVVLQTPDDTAFSPIKVSDFPLSISAAEAIPVTDNIFQSVFCTQGGGVWTGEEMAILHINTDGTVDISFKGAAPDADSRVMLQGLTYIAIGNVP